MPADVSRPEPLPGRLGANLAAGLNNALTRADQIHHSEGKNGMKPVAPRMADVKPVSAARSNAFSRRRR